jgi:antitoxin (DNA-binding transcriptional repressor) of toxin-antitoxin stability system
MLDAGESFVVTRRGVPIGELTPLAHARFVNREAALLAFTTPLRSTPDCFSRHRPARRSGPNSAWLKPPTRVGSSTHPWS